MLVAILAGILTLQQPATVLGSITPPAGKTLSAPVRVTLLPAQYAQMWDGEAQQRLDLYWEMYKPLLAQKKELFSEISVIAQREALDFVVGRMRGNPKINIASLTSQSTARGQFEFRQVPPGDYKVVATGTIDGRDVVWSEFLNVGSDSPVLVQLKQPAP